MKARMFGSSQMGRLKAVFAFQNEVRDLKRALEKEYGQRYYYTKAELLEYAAFGFMNRCLEPQAKGAQFAKYFRQMMGLFTLEKMELSAVLCASKKGGNDGR